MGLTKQYLRYERAGNFNIISSHSCNVTFVTLEAEEGRFVAVAACEDIIVWDLRLGEKVLVLNGDKHQVTCLASGPEMKTLAAGYSDGSIKVFDLKSGDNLTCFSGHRSAVICLAYDSQGHRLASGSKDTDIIVWDVVEEIGLSRLTGHKGVVTQIRFIPGHNYLVSASKDTHVKLWDLDTSFCFKTLVGHRTEVWGLVLMEGNYLVTGSGDSELRVWTVMKNDPSVKSKANVAPSESFVTGDDVDSEVESPLQCQKAGSILRASRGRVVSLTSDSSGRVLACHGSDNSVETFHFASHEEAKTKQRKRQRKMKKKANSEQEIVLSDELSLTDVVRRLQVIKVTDGKVKGVDLKLGMGGELRVAVSLNNNCVELHSMLLSHKGSESKLLRRISSQGHRSEVRAVAFSSDNLAIVSASGDSVKMWNRPSQVCLRTVETGFVLTTCFVPGDRHVLAGLKNGSLLIIDIASADILEEIPAHSKELWSIALSPDSRGCVTGGGDATVKFWQFELVHDEKSESKAKVLSLIHVRTLKVEETVLAVKISPNNNLIAVALLDSTVKIFFVDTLKFFVSLYGHKLPVLCLDISYDSTLIVTGSADRNIKIWGMDFGDCHKSLFAHEDSVTSVQFVPRTHQFFSCGKDGKVKQWDADSFDRILTLQGHFGEAWGLSVSPNGQYVVSCGSDRVVRLFARTEEPLVLSDEREEVEESEGLATGAETAVPGRGDLNLPSKKTVGSEQAAELLMECLEVCRVQRADPSDQLPPIMQAFQVKTTEEYLLEVLRRIRPSDREEAMLILPFTSVCELLTQLPPLLCNPLNTELVAKVAIFLVKIHHGPIVANTSLLNTIKKIQSLALGSINKLRDLVGYNLHGLQYLQRQVEEKDQVELFMEATNNKKTRKQRKKRKRTMIKL